MTAIRLYDSISRYGHRQHLLKQGNQALCGCQVNLKSGMAPIPPVTLNDLQDMICKQCWQRHQKAQGKA